MAVELLRESRFYLLCFAKTSVPLENLERSERMRVTSFIISSMLTTLMTLLATLSSIFRSRAALELENLALRHQIGVLRRAAAKRLKLTSADRLLWICLSRLWRGWRSALTIVKPETVIAWHRAGFRLFWTLGRCAATNPEDPRKISMVRDAT